MESVTAAQIVYLHMFQAEEGVGGVCGGGVLSAGQICLCMTELVNI